MSGTTGTVYPLIESTAGVYNYSDLYLPNVTGSTGRIVPAVGSLIVVDVNTLQVVASVNTTLLTFVLEDVLITNADDGLADVVSYGNDIFRAYYDTRATPYRLRIDSRVLINGASPVTYQIVRYPNLPTQTVPISRYYDASGTYVNSFVPLSRVASGVNSWICPDCLITVTLNDNEELQLQIFNDVGAMVAAVNLFAKASPIINDALAYQPKITGISVTSVQQLSDGDCYVFEKQSLDSLELQGVLTYQDGTTRTIEIDSKQCFLFGAEDFIAAYAGLKQQMILKYFLSSDEATTLTGITGSSINTTFNVVVQANNLSSPLKLSVMPLWNTATSTYSLIYYYYSTNRKAAINVTSYVSITTGTYVGNNYVSIQSFAVSLDLSKVDPTTYPTSTLYVQNVCIKLQPQSALIRYTLQDGVSSPYIYGFDSTQSRRPVIYYDSTLNQYFIPSTVFGNFAAVLQSFYTNANPPYDPVVDAAAPVPTHLLLRDPTQGQMITAALQPLTNYNTAFTVINAGGANYVGSTVIVEFVEQTSTSNTLILYGVPVDVYTGTYQG